MINSRWSIVAYGAAALLGRPGLGDIGGDDAPQAAQPDFENDHFDLLGSKHFPGCQRTEFEIG